MLMEDLRSGPSSNGNLHDSDAVFMSYGIKHLTLNL